MYSNLHIVREKTSVKEKSRKKYEAFRRKIFALFQEPKTATDITLLTQISHSFKDFFLYKTMMFGIIVRMLLRFQ